MIGFTTVHIVAQDGHRRSRVQARVADRLVVRGAKAGLAPRVGEVLEIVAGTGPGRYRVRWSDGHESIFSPGPGTTVDPAPRLDAEWQATVAARHARCAAWRRGVVAGVGREASIAQDALA
jgi:hypothetical protein